MTRQVIHEDNEGMKPASQRHTTERWWDFAICDKLGWAVGRSVGRDVVVGCAAGYHERGGSRIPRRSQCNDKNQMGLDCESCRVVVLVSSSLVVGLGWMRLAAMRCDGDAHAHTHINSLNLSTTSNALCSAVF